MAFCVECGTNVGEVPFCSNCGAKQKSSSPKDVAVPTEFSVVCEILGELWLEVKGDSSWSEFIRYNDLGLPLAYALTKGIVEGTNITEGFIHETWTGLLEKLNVVDQGYTSYKQFQSLALH